MTGSVHATVTGRSLTSPDAVGTHQLGAGPFGIEDMVGTRQVSIDGAR
jgi:hypothetical protein